MIDSTTITAHGTFYGLPLEVIDAIQPDELALYIAETDEAPQADPALDADRDIDAMSVEQIEGEIAANLFGLPIG